MLIVGVMKTLNLKTILIPNKFSRNVPVRGSLVKRLCLYGLTLSVLSGCATSMQPVKASRKVATVGSTKNVGYAPKDVQIIDAGTRVTQGRLWKKEVSNYTAQTMETITGKNQSPGGDTLSVAFEMGPGSAWGAGAFREMSIHVTSNLANGQQVRSGPVTGYLDKGTEYKIATGLNITSMLLGGAGTAWFLAGRLVFPNVTQEQFIGVGLGLIGGGLVVQGSHLWFKNHMVRLQEKRWSNLYLDALESHVEDIARAPAQALQRQNTGAATTAPSSSGQGIRLEDYVNQKRQE